MTETAPLNDVSVGGAFAELDLLGEAAVDAVGRSAYIEATDGIGLHTKRCIADTSTAAEHRAVGQPVWWDLCRDDKLHDERGTRAYEGRTSTDGRNAGKAAAGG